jgi:hypothetical protein
MVTIILVTNEGGVCLGAALVESDDGSTMMEGLSCSLIVSSPTTSPTSCLECLGFGELVSKIQEKERKINPNW